MTHDAIIHVIDDDSAMRDSLRMLLELEGFAVCTYASAETFLNEVRSEGNGCVVTDLNMPGVSGLDLLSALRERKFFLPVIMITAHGDAALAIEAMKRGAADFLNKPIDADTFFASLRKCYSHSNETEKLRRAELVT